MNEPFHERQEDNIEVNENTDSGTLELQTVNEENFQSMETIEQEREIEKKPSKWKPILMTVSAGVLGSAITLATTPLIDHYLEGKAKVNDMNIQSNQQEVTTASIVPTASNKSLADVIEQASTAIVGITNIQEDNQRGFPSFSESNEAGTGSGVIFKITENETYIVTNNHVVEGADTLEISLHDGQKLEARIVGADPLTDIAVLKMNQKVQASILEFGDSSQLRAGDEVIAIGNPLGLDLSRTVTQGIVSSTERTISITTSSGAWDLDVIQTDAAINPGNSGGALINTAGQLIGINSLKISESGVEGLGFAIPSNTVVPIVNELMKNGQVIRPYIGVGLASIEEVPKYYLSQLPSDIEKGVIVTSIDDTSPAAKAGIQVGDIIVSINGKEIGDIKELRKYLYNDASVGDKIKIQLYRKAKLQSVHLTLTSNKQS